jgi:hypothetical protein
MEEKAKALVAAIYANLEHGTFTTTKDPSPERVGNIIVGIHIREELMDLENLLYQK